MQGIWALQLLYQSDWVGYIVFIAFMRLNHSNPISGFICLLVWSQFSTFQYFFRMLRLSVTFEVILWFKTCCNLCCNSLVFLGFDRRFEKSQKPCCCRERNRFKSRVCSCEENAGKERCPLGLSRHQRSSCRRDCWPTHGTTERPR